MENLEKTSGEVDQKPFREENGRLLPGQQSLNPRGRPKLSKLQKRKIIIAREVELKLIEKIEKEIDEILIANSDLAKGIYLMKPVRDKKTGEIINIRVYKSKPDGQSIRDILDRIIGKPKQGLDITLGRERIVDKEQIDELLFRRTKNNSPGGEIQLS